jgi:AAA15 family ATPase/GTPase
MDCQRKIPRNFAMKIQSVELKHFKKFREQKFDFTNPETGLAKDLIVLIGMNGSGKTTLLQAIAATLGTAAGRLKKPSDLEWPGLNDELSGSNWDNFEPKVTVQAEFSDSEIRAVREFQQELQEAGHDLAVMPAENPVVSLTWQGEHVQADTKAEFFQFKGRTYASRLRKNKGFQIFDRVGTIFWYTEQRTSTSLTAEDPEKKIEITENILRDRLCKWRQFHHDIEMQRIKQLRPGQKDLYAEIERIYKSVFPNRSFEGPVPREGIDEIFSEPWFYLYDGKNLYEISEMSGGERAVFPMLMDFVNWNIHNSVILIDELELHLHPPMQQELLSALPRLGKNNQFIITTHSDYIEQLVPEEYIFHIEV